MASTSSNDESKIREHHYGATMIQKMSVDCLRPDPHRLVINFQISTPVSSPSRSQVRQKGKNCLLSNFCNSKSYFCHPILYRAGNLILVTYDLEEKKKKTIANPMSSDKRTTLIHERSMMVPEDDCGSLLYVPNNCCSSHETFFGSTEGEARVYSRAHRPMTQEEVEKFEQDWSNLWNPEAKLELD